MFNGPALDTAANLASVITGSWGATASELANDGISISNLNNRLNKPNKTFVFGAGNGSIPLYPALSPNAVAVGGTRFNADELGHYISETGFTQYFGANRAFPDIAMAAATTITNPFTNFPIIRLGEDDGGGGTSLAGPFMAGIVAVANQGRALSGQAPIRLAGNSNISSADVRDVTSGNGATFGFDSSTGRGSPKADKLVATWSGNQWRPPQITDVTAPANVNHGDQFQFFVGASGFVDTVEIWRDSNENGVFEPGGADSLITTSTTEPWFFTYDTSQGPPSVGRRVQVIGSPKGYRIAGTEFYIRGLANSGGSHVDTVEIFIHDTSSSSTSSSEGEIAVGFYESSQGWSESGATSSPTSDEPLITGSRPEAADAAIAASYSDSSDGSDSSLAGSDDETDDLFADDEFEFEEQLV
jgi:hypothetical protein